MSKWNSMQHFKVNHSLISQLMNVVQTWKSPNTYNVTCEAIKAWAILWATKQKLFMWLTTKASRTVKVCPETIPLSRTDSISYTPAWRPCPPAWFLQISRHAVDTLSLTLPLYSWGPEGFRRTQHPLLPSLVLVNHNFLCSPSSVWADSEHSLGVCVGLCVC